MLSRPIACSLIAVCALGSASSILAQTEVHRLDGSVVGDFQGNAVAGGGDIDDDGFDDVVVGAPEMLNADGSARTGSVAAYSGADGSELYRLYGDGEGDRFGGSVAVIGDVNADGFADFAAGTELNETVGYARVFSGADGAVLMTYTSTEVAGFSGGVAIAAAGDTNADGYDDVVVGAGSEASAGRVAVLSGLDGSELFVLTGVTAGGGFGFSVAGAGDVNADGLDDFLVGRRSLIPVFAGAVQVHSGADASVLFEYEPGLVTSPVVVGPGVGGAVAGVGDLNLDGHDDFAFGEFDDSTNGLSSGKAYVLSGVDGTLMFDALGSAPFQAMGQSVAGVGDVDGDRFPDVAVGAPGIGFSLSSGDVFIHSGVDGSVIRTLTGSADSERFGHAIASAGDVDGDGFADIVTGAPTFAANLGPGSAVVSSAGFVGTPSRERMVGVGCPLGTVRTPRIGFSQRAFIDETVIVELRGGVPGGVSTLFFGRDTPAALDFIGLPGCVLATIDIWGEVPIPTDALGQTSFALPFQPDPAAIGLGFVAQWVTPDPISPFALTLTFSDTLDLVIGG